MTPPAVAIQIDTTISTMVSALIPRQL